MINNKIVLNIDKKILIKRILSYILISNIYKEFYSFKSIMKRMPESSRQRIPYLLFNLFYRKFGKLISRVIPIGLMNSFGKMVRHLSYGID